MKHIINCLLLLIGALIVIVVFSPRAWFCSSTEPLLKAPLDKPGEQKKASSTQISSPAQIDKIELLDVKNVYRVSITASQISTYTVFKLSKPARIIAEMPGFMVDKKLAFPVLLQNNLISGIKGNTIDKNGKSTAHFEILLKQEASYDTSQQGTSLFIDIAKPLLDAGQKAPASQEPQTKKQPVVKPQSAASITPLKESAAEKALV